MQKYPSLQQFQYYKFDDDYHVVKETPKPRRKPRRIRDDYRARDPFDIFGLGGGRSMIIRL